MDLIAKADAALVRDRAERARREPVNHTAWDIDKCVRQLYYKWTTAPVAPDYDPTFLWKGRFGEAIEQIFKDAISQSRVFHVPSEWSTFEHEKLRFPVRYQTDLEIVDHDDVIAVVDVKNGEGRELSEMKKNDGRPKQEHIEQLGFYMGARKRLRGYLVMIGRGPIYRTQQRFDLVPTSDPPHVRLVGVNGDREWDTGVSFAAQIDKLARLEAHVAQEDIPDRPYVAAIKNGEIRRDYQSDNMIYKGDWQCQYCPYRAECWKEQLREYSQSDNRKDLIAAGHEPKPAKRK